MKNLFKSADSAQAIWGALGLVAAFFWLQAKVSGVFPTVFQDEWIYSMHSRLLPLSDSPIANYLYSWVYSGTNVCGLDFYSCAKQSNVIFMLIFTIGIYLIARRYLGFYASAAIAFLSVISPISTYASFFMPESMYFAFSVFAIWAVLELRDRNSLIWALGAGALLGATALVKPHSLFLLPVIGLFIVFVVKPEGSSLLKRIGSGAAYLAGFLVFKFGLGFLLAGSAGLVWFGTSYEATLNNVLNPGANGIGSSELFGTPAQALAAGQQLLAADAVDAPKGIAELFLAQLGGHYLGLFALAGVTLPALISLISTRAEQFAKLRELAWLIALSLVIFVPAFALFAALAINSGDPLQDRLVMRYYEFLIPVAFIAGIAGFKAVQQLAAKFKLAVLLTTAVGLFVVGIVGVGQYLPLIWDGAMLQGLATQRWLVAIYLIVSAAILIANLGRKEQLLKTLWAFLVPTVVVSSSFVATSALRDNALAPVYFDLAGQYARDNLTPVEQNDLVVVGQVRNELEAAKFWIDNPNVDQFVSPANSTVELGALPVHTKWVIAMNGVVIAGNVSIVQGGDNWNLYKVN